MDYRKLIIRGISYSQTITNSYILLLEDEISTLKLPIVIGNYEAQAISLGLNKDLQISRPLTHDLFARFVSTAKYSLVSVVIYKIVEGVFHSYIYFKHRETKEELVIDARTSDAVALAVRFNAPIYATPHVVDEAGILLNISKSEEEEQGFGLDDEKKIGYKEDIIKSGYEENIIKSGYEENIMVHYKDINIKDLDIELLEELLEYSVSEEDFDTAIKVQEELKKRKNNIE